MDDERVDPSDRYNYAIHDAYKNEHYDIVKLLATDPRVQTQANMSEERLLNKYTR